MGRVFTPEEATLFFSIIVDMNETEEISGYYKELNEANLGEIYQDG